MRTREPAHYVLISLLPLSLYNMCNYRQALQAHYIAEPAGGGGGGWWVDIILQLSNRWPPKYLKIDYTFLASLLQINLNINAEIKLNK